MANTIQLKRSAVASKVPLTTDLSLGELAINTYDGKVYIKKNNGSDSIVEISGDKLPLTGGVMTGVINANSNKITNLATPTLTTDAANASYVNSARDTRIALSTVTTKGDLILGTGASTVGRLGVGTDGCVLMADSSQASGAIWSTIPSSLPTQTGNSGKYLTTNGTDASWSTVSASAAPGGSAGNVQYNVAGTSIGGSSVVNIQAEGSLMLTSQSGAITAPGTGNMTIVNRPKAGPSLIHLDQWGNEFEVGQCLGSADIAWWNPPGNGTGVPGVCGMVAASVSATATARNVAATNIATRQKRLGYVSAASTSVATGQYWTVGQYTLGNGTIGGFMMKYRFIISDTASVNPSASMFVGMSSTLTAPTAINPSTMTNCIGIGHESGGSAFQIYYGGSAAQAPITLNGTNFPISSISTDCYELTLYSPNKRAGVVYYNIVRLGTAYSQSGKITGTNGTQLPALTTLLAPRAWRATNGTASAVGIDICHLYLEMFQY